MATPVFATNENGLPPIEDSDEELDSLVANGDEVGNLAGWRLEWRSDGYARFRWQLKDATGNPITYQTDSGKTGYKRGSKYVGKKQR